MSKSILFTTTVDISAKGGGSIATREIIEALENQQNVDLHLICPRFDNNFECNVDPGKIKHIPGRKAGGTKWHVIIQYYMFKNMYTTIKKYDIDCIISRLNLSCFGPPLIAKYFSVPYVLLVRGKLSRRLEMTPWFIRRFGKLAIQLNINTAKECYVAYREIQQELDKYSRDGYESTILPNAVDPKKFYPIEQSRARTSIGLDIDNSAFVIGFAGSMKKYHSVDLLIESVSNLNNQNYPLQLLLIGKGPQTTKLRSLCKESGIDHKVKFTGHIEHNSLNEYLSACDILFGASNPKYPTNPIKCYEYLACGRPVISPLTEELRFIEDHNFGVGIGDPNLSEIMNAIEYLYSLDEKDRERLGNNGRKYVLNNHTWDNFAKTILNSID